MRNMIRWMFFSFLSGLFVFDCGKALAAEGETPRLGGFIQGDYFFFNEADDKFKDQSRALRGEADALAAIGQEDIDTKEGPGGRLGLTYAPSESVRFGPSLGYIKGPQHTADFDGSALFFPASLRREIDVEFLRLLGEVSVKRPLSGALSVRLGAGAGVARGSMDVEESWFIGGINNAGGGEDSWTGFTWEVSPALVFEGDRLGLELGFRYAQFPDHTAHFDSLALSPKDVHFAGETMGVFVGMNF